MEVSLYDGVLNKYILYAKKNAIFVDANINKIGMFLSNEIG
jgi:hypothetical protein